MRYADAQIRQRQPANLWYRDAAASAGIRGYRGSETLRGELLSGAGAVVALVVVLAVIYRFATGESPWPVFVLAELPGAGFGFVLLALSSPRRQ